MNRRFESLGKLVQESGFAAMMSGDGWKNLVMIIIACVLLYLGIKKQYEPLLMVGIAMGCLLANVSALGGFGNALYHQDLWDEFLKEGGPHAHSYGYIMANGGLIDILYMGVKAGHLSLPDLHRHRRHDGLRSPDFQSQIPAAGRGGAVRRVLRLLRRDPAGLQRQ